MRLRGTIVAAALVLGGAGPVAAQAVEVTPFLGYRFGGDFFELITEQPVDLDGAASLGLIVDVALDDDVRIEALYSHQAGQIDLSGLGLGGPPRLTVTVDHFQAGGVREFPRGPWRPFLAGLLGLTRFAGGNDSEIRFSLGAGGGVKAFPTPHLGLRLDGRVYVTFVDVGSAGGGGFCTPGVCIIGFSVSTVWQADVTAGLVVAF